jgi:hypothetical protein
MNSIEHISNANTVDCSYLQCEWGSEDGGASFARSR